MLRPENGDRLGVVDKVVMVTDGLSDIRPDLVEPMARVSFPAYEPPILSSYQQRVTSNKFTQHPEMLEDHSSKIDWKLPVCAMFGPTQMKTVDCEVIFSVASFSETGFEKPRDPDVCCGDWRRGTGGSDPD